MSHTIFCVKLKKQATALQSPPYPGALGERIHAHISQEAWDMWLKEQVILINENRLSLQDSKARAYLLAAMQDFLFGSTDDNTD